MQAPSTERVYAPLIREYRALRSASTVETEWWQDNPDDSIPGRARAKQRPPEGDDWFVWLVMAGRGFGKSRTGAEWINREARRSKPGDQVLIAGRTPSDVRDYALDGPGGLLTHYPDIDYQPANRRLVWPNGVEGLIRSGANPEEFRGFSGEKAWLEEFAAWDYPAEAWSNLMYGVRERNPQIGITTTPRPIPTLKAIRDAPGTVVVSGSSYENRANLSEKWVENVLEPNEGTRIGRQEIHAELLDEVEGALWSLKMIDELRVRKAPDLQRIVVGVDPQGSKAEGSMTGIVVVGIGHDKHLYVLEDGSINGSPAEWGTRAVALYRKWGADRIVAERNFGGDMVEHTIRTVDDNAAFKMVTASRGKRQRAEPISSRYEQGRGHHVGTFAALEDEMSSFTPDSKDSPNRMDAMVWAGWELTQPRVAWGAA